MKNIELYKRMKRELDNYQIGLHNIGVDKYKNLVNFVPEISKKLEITEAEISEKSIADSIIRTGLRVVDRPMGLRSTVMPVKDFNENSFDYTYNMWEVGTVWNVIVAIPYFLKYEGEEFFIGDFSDWVNISNLLMFNPSLLREFIYGYYSKEITAKHLIPRSDSSNSFCIDHTFSDDLEFVSNPNFFEQLDNYGKNLVLKRMFEENSRLLTNLKLANNDSKLGMIFRTSYERFVIRNTRKQAKRLVYKK